MIILYIFCRSSAPFDGDFVRAASKFKYKPAFQPPAIRLTLLMILAQGVGRAPENLGKKRRASVRGMLQESYRTEAMGENSLHTEKPET